MKVTVKRTNEKSIEKLGEIAWDDNFNISSQSAIIQYYQGLAKSNNLTKYSIEIDGYLVYFQ
jgi:hypothetical protein